MTHSHLVPGVCPVLSFLHPVFPVAWLCFLVEFGISRHWPGVASQRLLRLQNGSFALFLPCLRHAWTRCRQDHRKHTSRAKDIPSQAETLAKLARKPQRENVKQSACEGLTSIHYMGNFHNLHQPRMRAERLPHSTVWEGSTFRGSSQRPLSQSYQA